MSHEPVTPPDAALPHTEAMSPDETEQTQSPPLPAYRELEEHPLWHEFLAEIEANRRAGSDREVVIEGTWEEISSYATEFAGTGKVLKLVVPTDAAAGGRDV